MNLFRSFLIVILFTFSLFADTYDNYSVSLTNSGYTQAGLVVKSNDVDRFTISILQTGYFSAGVSGNSNVKFDISTVAMPDKATHTLTSYGPVYYTAGQIIYLSASAPDQTANQTYTLALTLNTGNQIPVAVNDTAETNGIAPVTINILNNDYDLDGSLVASSVSIKTSPTKGTITNSAGVITYTPTSFNLAGDSFTYTVRDNNNAESNIATVTITYPKPIAYDKTYVVIPNGVLHGNVITDPQISYNIDDNLTMNTNTTPAIGTLNPATIVSNGDFSYTALSTTGSTTFTYSIKNKYNMVSNTATATISINTYCADAKTVLSTDNNCSTNDTNSTSGSVTASGAQYYKIILAENGVLDINLTNTEPQTGGTTLYFDFGSACGEIFGQGTTSQLDAGYKSKTASMILNAGTYYLGLQGKSNTNPTEYSVNVTFRSACAGGPPIYPNILSSVGINEPGVNYDVDKNITTKIVNKQFGLHASYLDFDGNVDTYNGSYGGGKTVDMSVIVAHADGDTCSDAKVIGQGIIAHNTQSTVITPLTIDKAYKNRRTKITAFDFGQLFNDASGLNCGTSSLNSSLCLVPACFNNVQNIRSVFPPAFQPGVMQCIYGDGGGGAAPCDSNAYNGNCGGKRLNITPVKYDNDLGCAMCLADAMQGDVCSADAFAIRPNDFNTTIVPDQIFLAGKATPLTFKAEDYAGSPSNYYNENENTSFTVAIDINDTTKICAQPSINFSPIVDFTNGIVTNNYALNNVGDFNLTMHETTGAEFALVDADDSSDTLRLITPFTTQIKVIPHHFGIDGNLKNGSNDRTFTYLSNFQLNDTNASRNVSASMDLNVSAETENNTTTSNYTSLCYAKGGNLKLTLANAIVPNPVGSLNNLLWYHYTPDSNGSIPLDGITTAYQIPFLSTQFDSNITNGTAQFNYKINFDRNATKVVNPFIVVVSDLNVTDTDGASGAKAGGNATFLFGRTHASRQRYSTNTGPANIYYESFCFGALCNKALLPNGINSTRTDDVRWYVIPTPFHTTPTDGSVGIVVEKIGTNAVGDIVDATDNPGGNPSVTNLSYDGSKGYPYKTTMQNEASPWLIHNENNDATATRNEFQVEFNNQGDWTGENETSTTTKDSNTSITNRRIMW